jgi:hypothetical protein
MKNLKTMLVLMVGIGLFAASCEDDDNNNNGETIVPFTGKWDIIKVGTTVAGVETLTDAPQNQPGCDKDYIHLKNDNVVIEGDYGSGATACSLTAVEGIYSRSHNNLTRIVDGETTVQDIVNLTFTELKLRDADGDLEVYRRH